MSFGGMLPEKREYMWGSKPHIMLFFEKERELKAQFEILSRALNNANKDAHKFEATLDHLDHIKTEIGRLKTCLGL